MMVLQRCPHCGGFGTIWSDNGKMVYAVCTSCGTRTKDFLTPKEASDVWNERIEKTTSRRNLFDSSNNANVVFNLSLHREAETRNEPEVYTDVNRLKYKLFDMKWTSMSKEEKRVLDKCIDMVDKLPIIKISRGELR